MAAPYSLDLRERVVAMVAAGMSCGQAARHFQVSKSTAIRWTRRQKQTGSPAALPMGGKKPFTLAGEEAWIRRRVEEKPDLTGRDLLAELTRRGITVSYYAVWHFLDHAGLTFKKNSVRQRTGPRRRRASPAAVEAASAQGSRPPVHFHRRDLGEDQYDAPTWAVPKG